jgi:hypothetical protein
MNAEDVVDLLKLKYAAPAWAFLPQVRNQTGYNSVTRTADAIAMGLWPSRGLHLHGFEIKVDRGDWLSELKRPEKAEEIARHCDYWWIVATENVISLGEAPTMWGVMLATKKGLKVIKEATLLSNENIPKQFLAAILRKAQECIAPEAKIKEAFDAGFAKGKEETNHFHKHQMEEYRSLQQTVNNFERISGVHIDKWRGDDVGEAFRMALNGDHLRIKRQLEGLLETSKEITQAIEEKLRVQ